MKKTARRAAGWLLALSLLLSLAPGVRAAGAEETADWLCRAVSAPGVGSVGGRVVQVRAKPMTLPNSIRRSVCKSAITS